MEEIYPPQYFGSSDRFPLKRYFKEYSDLLTSELPAVSANDDRGQAEYFLAVKTAMENMGVELQLNDVKCLSETCSVNLSTCESENNKDFPIDIPENIYSSEKLPKEYVTSHRNHKLAVTKYRSEVGAKINTLHHNLRNKRSYHRNINVPSLSVPPDLEPGSDFVLSILVYRPFPFKYFNEKNTSEKLRFNHEILALGRNTLSELRDTIICPSDEGLCKEVASTSDDITDLGDARSKYPSGFIFIDNVFYNDFREPNSIDYSFPIIEWAKEKKIKNLQGKNMENVTLASLTPRFGYPYLYLHQGDCEHLLVFSDAKLLDHSDCLNSISYPYVAKLSRSSNKMCCMCSATFAKWICIDSDRLPQNKMFMCTECCNAYHYLDEEKIGKFKLYPYCEKHLGE